MQNQPPIKDAVTVAEMARILGLSRARFYELMKDDVFPEPSRNPETKRPFFDRQQQELCLLIRRTNRGANGRTVLFYGRRLAGGSPTERRPTRKSKTKPKQREHDASVEALRRGLSQLGLTEATPSEIRAALTEQYPDGVGDVDESEVLLSVFRQLKRRNPPDKHAR
jgi:hypothetical protein